MVFTSDSELGAVSEGALARPAFPDYLSAFGASVQEGSPSRVVFRVRNVLVEVRLGPADDAQQPSQDLGINGPTP